MVVDFILYVILLVVCFLCGLIFAVLVKLGMPPIAGELIVDTHDWNVDKFNFQMNRMPFTEIADHKYVTLKITQAIIADPRDINNRFNDTSD